MLLRCCVAVLLCRCDLPEGLECYAAPGRTTTPLNKGLSKPRRRLERAFARRWLGAVPSEFSGTRHDDAARTNSSHLEGTSSPLS